MRAIRNRTCLAFYNVVFLLLIISSSYFTGIDTGLAGMDLNANMVVIISIETKYYIQFVLWLSYNFILENVSARLGMSIFQQAMPF